MTAGSLDAEQQRINAARTDSGTLLSTRSPLFPCVTRAASPASCTFMPKSIAFSRTWVCPCAWWSPPMTPNENHGFPSFITNAGINVCSGRLCGAI